VAVSILISAVVSLTFTPMLCAKLLRHKPAAKQSRVFAASERVWQAIVAAYDRALTVVLEHQRLTLLVAVGTLVPPYCCTSLCPRVLSAAGHRRDPGHHRGVAIDFVRGDADRQQALAQTLLADPAVASLSSFIGVDGINTTLNSGAC